MNKTADQWSRVRAKAVCAGSQAQAENVLEEALQDIARLYELLRRDDIVIACECFDEKFPAHKSILRWADEALERFRERQRATEDNAQFGVGA